MNMTLPPIPAPHGASNATPGGVAAQGGQGAGRSNSGGGFLGGITEGLNFVGRGLATVGSEIVNPFGVFDGALKAMNVPIKGNQLGLDMDHDGAVESRAALQVHAAPPPASILTAGGRGGAVCFCCDYAEYE